MFDKILVSALSIKPVTFENLNTASNFCRVETLYVVNLSITSAFIVSAVFAVDFASYLTFETINTEVVSGSFITGLTEATLYGFNWVTISAFDVSDNTVPDFALIEIFTTPYCGVSSSSPPHALTDNAFG